MREPDLFVLGGGILGLSAAFLAASKHKLRVELWRRCDEDCPQADTLRNMAWLHSGLAFSGLANGMELAQKMRVAGDEMIDAFNLPREMRGVFRVLGRKAPLFEQNAKELGVPFEEISRTLAESYAGDLVGAGDDLFYRVPDAPFSESTVMNECRLRAIEAGVSIRVSRVNVEVRLAPASPNRYEIVLPADARGQRRTLQPERTLLAAGVRLPAILDKLGVSHNLAAFRTPILCRRGLSWLRETRLFHHYMGSQGISVLSHPGDGLSGNDCEVICGRMCRAITNVEERFVQEPEIHATVKQLPNPLRAEFLYNPAQYTVTAAYKIGVRASDVECPREEPKILYPTDLGLRGLYAAFPGKATMGYSTARELLQEMLKAQPRRKNRTDEALSRDDGPSSWVDPIKMHWQYPDLDERRPGEVGDA